MPNMKKNKDFFISTNNIIANSKLEGLPVEKDDLDRLNVLSSIKNRKQKSILISKMKKDILKSFNI
jgi:hypothetical protein